MSRLIIGLVGKNASGKSHVAKYIKRNYGASVYSLSSVLKTTLKLLNVPITRENLTNLTIDLANRHGKGYLARAAVEDVRRDENDLIVIDGIRWREDVSLLRQEPGFSLVAIKLDNDRLRWERARVRTEKADEAGMTFEEFLEVETWETERFIPELMAEADETIDGSGGLSGFDSYSQIDSIVARLRERSGTQHD